MDIKNITGKAFEASQLRDISDVTFENNRLVLRVSDPIAARKFGLSDKTWRYEFDGGSMYWYYSKDESEPSNWHCSCGKGTHTCVDNSTLTQIKVVKYEMSEQVILKGMLEYFKDRKDFTSVAIELNNFHYGADGCLNPLKRA